MIITGYEQEQSALHLSALRRLAGQRTIEQDFGIVGAAMNEGINGMTTLNASGHQALSRIEAEFDPNSEGTMAFLLTEMLHERSRIEAEFERLRDCVDELERTVQQDGLDPALEKLRLERDANFDNAMYWKAERDALKASAQVCEAEHWDRANVQMLQDEREALKAAWLRAEGHVTQLIEQVRELRAESDALKAAAQICEAEHWDRANVQMLQEERDALKERLRISKGERSTTLLALHEAQAERDALKAALERIAIKTNDESQLWEHGLEREARTHSLLWDCVSIAHQALGEAEK
jgi:hypothetical protein